MILKPRERRGTIFYTVFLSLLIHLFVFLGASLDILWPKRVAARKPLPIRIVSVDQPKPDKRLPPDPNSRLLSNANRRESGAGKPSPKPKLRREEKDRIPARRGTQNPAVAALPPPPSPRVLPQPEPTPPVNQKKVPPRKRVTEPPKPQVEKPKPKPKVEEKRAPVAKEAQAPRPAPKAQEKTTPAPPAEKKAKPDPPKSIEKTRPALAEKKPQPKKKPVQKKVAKKAEKPKPEKRRADKKAPEVKVARKREKTERPKLVKKKPAKKKPVKKKVEKPKEKKPLEVASLPKPEKVVKPRKTKKTPPKKPQDVLAMFRAKPSQRGRPNAPKMKLSDEDADRIAMASTGNQLEKEEGEVVSLNTRDVRYSSYFAHLKRKIREAWDPTPSRYPGDVLLKFVLREDGSLRRVQLLDSSGYRILDDIAVAAVSEPKFKPFPPSLRAKRKLLPITVLFNYAHQ